MGQVSEGVKKKSKPDKPGSVSGSSGFLSFI